MPCVRNMMVVMVVVRPIQRRLCASAMCRPVFECNLSCSGPPRARSELRQARLSWGYLDVMAPPMYLCSDSRPLLPGCVAIEPYLVVNSGRVSRIGWMAVRSGMLLRQRAVVEVRAAASAAR